MTSPNPAFVTIDSVAPHPQSDRDFLIRSEEQLRVATERVVAGVARLEKFVVTETKTITVEVAHEEVRLVHGPPHDGPITPTAQGPGQLNQARWMYVNREEIVVTKRVVPVERVRLEVERVVEQRRITESVRRERIDTGEPTSSPDIP